MGDAAVVSGRCQYSAFVSGLWKFDYHVFGVGLSGSSYVEFFALLGYLHSHIYINTSVFAFDSFIVSPYLLLKKSLK